MLFSSMVWHNKRRAVIKFTDKFEFHLTHHIVNAAAHFFNEVTGIQSIKLRDFRIKIE